MVLIRPIVPDELNAISKLSQKIFSGDANYSEDTWECFLITGTILAAIQDDKFVGFIIVIPHPNPFFCTSCDVCSEFIITNGIDVYYDIFAFGTVEEYRKKGIGSALMIEGLKLTGGHPVFLHVRVSNENAISLYKKHGFVMSETKEIGYYSTPKEDAYMMYHI